MVTQYHNLWECDDVPFDDGTRFYIPENVYIIGTMNDIDRSVESMDFAMRRRFTFREVTAEASEVILDSVEKWPDGTGKDQLIEKMRSLNGVIRQAESLGTEFQLGGAYFQNIEKCSSYDELWNHYLVNILNEYLRGMQPRQQDELRRQMKEAFDNV